MKLVCLFAELHQYHGFAAALSSHGVECIALHDEFALMRRGDSYTDGIVLVDAGQDHALLERLLCWLECQIGVSLPIIFRANAGDTSFVVRALRAGAADVLPRGLHPAEMTARLQMAVQRRQTDARPRRIRLGDFELDRIDKLVSYGSEMIELTRREFDLLWLLFSKPGACLSREMISSVVWGKEADISSRTLEQHVHRLRKKLGLQQARGITIRAAYGQGYRVHFKNTPREAPVPSKQDLNGQGYESTDHPQLPLFHSPVRALI